LPPLDRLEPNDDAGGSAARLGTKVTSVKATIDFWDDQIDVYRLYLRKNQNVKLTLNGPEGSTSNLLLWKARDEARERPAQPASPRRPGDRPRADARDRLQGARDRLVLRGGQAHRARLRPVRTDDRAALEELFGRDVAQSPRRIAHHDDARRDIRHHNGAGTDERLFADFHRGAEHGSCADARSCA